MGSDIATLVYQGDVLSYLARAPSNPLVPVPKSCLVPRENSQQPPPVTSKAPGKLDNASPLVPFDM